MMDSSRVIRPWSLVRRAALPLVAMVAACGDGGRTAADAESAAAIAEAEAGTGATETASGEQLYQRCTTCHQASGAGLPGAFPPLAGSEYVATANVAVPIRIVLRGMQGPVTVRGEQYNGVMPAFGTGVEMTDDEVARVLTYVRQSWGNKASAVTPQQVAAERAAASAATGPVTAAELQPLL